MIVSFDQFLYEQGRKRAHIPWKGTFRDYFELAVKNPIITKTAVQRVYDMILSHGVEKDAEGQIVYLFFKDRIFGMETQIQQIMTYLKAASMGLDIKKRVLLLLGPPGGGKSQILSLLKKGMEDYSYTNNGAIYAIEDCPIHEDPMHLISEKDRHDLWKKYAIKVEGKLCPVCQFRFETDWKKNLNHVPVTRVYASEDNRIGVGTFAPAERNDMEELYGSVDLSKVDYYGNSGDVRAYTFNGELHTANRGIMEFIEVLKAKEDFLHVLLTLAEEQVFKTPRFPLQYVDEMLIAHTNEGEFYRFISKKENEAVVDRLFIVRMPYNMDVLHEEKIYHAALKTKLVVQHVTVHPGAVRLLSQFAIETRKHEDPLRSGMSGISPRFILNTLALSLVGKNTHTTHHSQITPLDVVEKLMDVVYHYPVLSMEKRHDYLTKIKTLYEKLSDYENVLMKHVGRKHVGEKQVEEKHVESRDTMDDMSSDYFDIIGEEE
jgi:serine protein kinase